MDRMTHSVRPDRSGPPYAWDKAFLGGKYTTNLICPGALPC